MQNILCEKNEQIILNHVFEDFKVLLQDSDAEEEKEKVKESLKRMADTTTYLVLGDEGVGKTSLLNAVFQDMASFSERFLGEMCEYRFGEQELTTPVTDGMQKQFVTTENMLGISIIDTNHQIRKRCGEYLTTELSRFERENELSLKLDAVMLHAVDEYERLYLEVLNQLLMGTGYGEQKQQDEMTEWNALRGQWDEIKHR